MIELKWILAFLVPALLLLYFYFPRLHTVCLRKLGHLPFGFTAEKFNYLLTPFLTILAVCTTYSAFHVQWQFNDEQMQNMETERAEKIVFEFINMHSSMVKDIRVTDITTGNRSFHFIYYECMSMRHVLDSLLKRSDWKHLYLRPRCEEELTAIAFKSCYFGISKQKNGALENWVQKRYNGVYDDFLKYYIDAITALQRLNEERVFLTEASAKRGINRDSLSLVRKQTLMAKTKMMNEYFESDQVFLFADGHMPVLDSYMRLLCTTLKQFNKLMPASGGADGEAGNGKEYYLDLLRSQLSSHELLIISLYAFTQTNLKDWFASGYLSSRTGCANNLVRDVNTFLMEKRAGISDWERYVTGNEKSLDSLQVLRNADSGVPAWDYDLTCCWPAPSGKSSSRLPVR